jgi:hypothetical protein
MNRQPEADWLGWIDEQIDPLASREWEQVRAQNTVGAYERFLAKWSWTGLAAEAAEQLAELLRVRLLATPEDQALRRRYLAVRSHRMRARDERQRRVPVLRPLLASSCLLGAAGGGLLCGLLTTGAVLLLRLLLANPGLVFEVFYGVAGVLCLAFLGSLKRLYEREGRRLDSLAFKQTWLLVWFGLCFALVSFQRYLDLWEGDVVLAVGTSTLAGLFVGGLAAYCWAYYRLKERLRVLGRELGPLPPDAPFESEPARAKYLGEIP